MGPVKLEERHPDKVRRRMSLLKKNKKEVEVLFKEGDRNSDGVLDLEEAMGQGMDKATFREIDANNDGLLTQAEFAQWQARVGNGSDEKQNPLFVEETGFGFSNNLWS